MIEFVRGVIAESATDHAVVDVSGIGLRVQLSPGTAGALRQGETHQIPTSLVVREDAWTLFGFHNVDEREVFLSVQTVSGIGPRTAQTLVGALTSEGVRQAILAGDEKALMRAPGIGRKGAQRMILELADKLAPVGPSGRVVAADAGIPPGRSPVRENVLISLTSLGFSTGEATVAIDSVVAQNEREATTSASELSVSDMIRAALLELNRT